MGGGGETDHLNYLISAYNLAQFLVLDVKMVNVYKIFVGKPEAKRSIGNLGEHI
jgi:hypothetical protein